MMTIYRLNADELDSSFIESLRAMFKHKEIEIAVYESDETEYLLRSPINRQRLMDAKMDIESGQNLVTPDQTIFQ